MVAHKQWETNTCHTRTETGISHTHEVAECTDHLQSQDTGENGQGPMASLASQTSRNSRLWEQWDPASKYKVENNQGGHLTPTSGLHRLMQTQVCAQHLHTQICKKRWFWGGCMVYKVWVLTHVHRLEVLMLQLYSGLCWRRGLSQNLQLSHLNWLSSELWRPSLFPPLSQRWSYRCASTHPAFMWLLI